MIKKEPLVSIITPSYNAERYIEDTINSVLKQSYSNFEMLIVDDNSTDNTRKIVEKYSKQDKRIKLFILSEKGGASEARNKALKEAKGKYIAFLDSDDLWKPEKLEKQINFMEENNIYFSYTDYEYMDSNGNLLGKKRVSPKKVSYFKMLLGDTIGCLTVVYNASKVGKINIPRLAKRNDYAIWCLALKKVKVGYKYNEILSIYRKSPNSISSGKKVKLLKYHYQMHKEVNLFPSLICCFFTMINIITYICNIKIRDKKILKKYKVGIVGHLASGKKFSDGQTVKTRNLYDKLVEIYGNELVYSVDTCNWRKKRIRLFLNCLSAIRRCDNVVLLTAKNGVKIFIPLFRMINFFYKKNLHYVLIGSWLYDVMMNNKYLLRSLKKFNGIYVENYLLMNKLETVGLNNLVVMPNFKNIISIEKDKIKKIDPCKIKMCIFSRIMFEKGIEDALECIKKLSDKYKDKQIILDIYGPIHSNYKERFIKLSSEFPPNVNYCGIVCSDSSVDVIKEYDILLFPTHFNTEGIPGTILDAYASGVPVVASKWDNYSEIIDDGQTGLVFEMLDNEDFFNKVDSLILNPKKIKELKLRALNKYKQYAPDEVIKKLVDNF